ncbi:hypothetical protein P8452_00942 [Trifolium repens]|nr:hypothetical protein P8452_00942 [Trifolium repens]
MLKYALSLSNFNTTCLVFNYFVYLTDAQLITIAERTPNLRRLVLSFQLWRGGVVELYTIHDLRSHLSRAGLQKLLVFNRRRCLKCTNKKNIDPRRASFGHMVDVWRQDEIISLAH